MARERLKNVKKIFLFCSPSGERKRWVGLPPAGRQLKVAVRIFVKKGSDFIQKAPPFIMATLKIRKFKDPILKKRCRKVRKIDEEIKKIIVNMVQTMEKEQGIGLAAPQVGFLKKIIVVKTDFKNQRILALINPKIVKKSPQKERLEEGCLSFPGIFLEIKRAKEIKIKAKDIKGEEVEIKTKGILARVIQHEIDHLNGILFYRRLSFIKSMIFRLKYFHGFN